MPNTPKVEKPPVATLQKLNINREVVECEVAIKLHADAWSDAQTPWNKEHICQTIQATVEAVIQRRIQKILANP